MNDTRIKPVDAVWLMMESADTPMHIGVLAIFKKPRNAASNYLSRWAQQMRKSRTAVAPWNYCLAGRAGASINPRFVQETDFDLDYHFRHSALPEPGGERELGVMVSRLHSHALDRSRPLWEFHLIEGLEHNRFAFYVKIHHALVDNVSAIPMMMSVLSESANRRNMLPPWARPINAAGQGEANNASDGKSSAGFFDSVETMASIGKTGVGLLRNALRGGAAGSFLMPHGTPRSTLNRPINAQRRFTTAQFKQARIARLADATDSTLNEILAYLCSSTLRRFFKEYNALPDESLVGALPISLRERSEQVPGNTIAGLRVPLATHLGDPLARLQAIKASLQKVREDRESLPQAAAIPYAMLRAAPIYASQMPRLGRFVPPLFNLVVSNTQGPNKRRYYNGALLEAIYPMASLMQFSALSIDCVSYAGILNIGLTGARDTLPHLQRLAVYMDKALEDLEELVQIKGAPA